MPSPKIYMARTFQNGPLVHMARVEALSGAPVTQATLSGVTCRVKDLRTGTTVLTPSVTPAANVFDSFVTRAQDPRWTRDNVGYNFRHVVPAAAFPLGDREYLVQYTFTAQPGGEQIFLDVRVHTTRRDTA
jgi:hypothetical protein